MIGTLLNLFRPTKAIEALAGPSSKPVQLKSIAVPTAAQSVMEPTPIRQTGPHHSGEPVPYYPRKGPAVPAVPPKKILSTQHKLIRELRQASSLSFDDFDQFILPAIDRYAQFVHLLPASEYDHHSDLGGLFRHGLEVALNASRRSEGKEFALNEVPSIRKFQIFRWRACSLLGGMLHDLGKAVIDVGASDLTGEVIWNPHIQTLWSWVEEHQLDYYTITWRETRRHREHDAISATALLRIIPDETMRWMGEHRGRAAYDAMLMALTGSTDRNNPLIEIIKSADGDSVKIDRTEAQKRLAAVGEAGSRSNAALLVRAMRERVLQGEWQINQLGCPVWYTTAGIFVMYPQAAKEVIDHLRTQGTTSIPNEPPIILSILREAGVIAPNVLPTGETYDLHRVLIHAVDRNGETVVLDLTAIKFVSDRIIPDYFTLPTAVEVEICDPDGKVISTGTIKPFDAPREDAAQPAEPVVKQEAAPSAPTKPSRPKGKKEPKAADQAPLDALVEAGEAAAAARRTNATTVPPPIDPADQHADSDFVLPNYSDPEAFLGDDDLVAMSAFDSDEPASAPAPTQAGELRDWHSEDDHRTTVIEENLEIARNPFPPTSIEGAKEWLGNQKSGLYLEYILDQQVEGVLKWGRDIHEVDDLLSFRYPLCVEGCGTDPAMVLDIFSNEGWIETDPSRTSRKTFPLNLDKDVISTVRFNYGISTTLRLLLKQPAAKRASPNDLGPYLADNRALVLSINGYDGEVGRATIRGAFYEYLQDQYPDPECGVKYEMDAQITKHMHRFVTMHPTLSALNFKKYASHQENCLLEAQGQKGLLRYVVQYNPGIDEITFRKALEAAQTQS